MLRSSDREVLLEACCGALHNLTAHDSVVSDLHSVNDLKPNFFEKLLFVARFHEEKLRKENEMSIVEGESAEHSTPLLFSFCSLFLSAV